jgi:hypothetical protein
MNPAIRTLVLCAALPAGLEWAEAPAFESDPPKIHGETVNGRPIELPEAAAGKIALLLLGFSKQGGEQTGVWEDHVSKDFADDPRFTVYTIAVLEGVPALFRGMVKSGIRSGTPAPKRDRMVTTVSGEAALKKFAGVSDSKIPYLVLLDASGHVRWRGHGPFEQGQYGALKAVVKHMEAEAKGSQNP